MFHSLGRDELITEHALAWNRRKSREKIYKDIFINELKREAQITYCPKWS